MNSDISSKVKDKAEDGRIDVVIVNYNSGNILYQSLQYLLSSKQQNNLNIIVVDNGSQDASLQAIKPFQSRIELLENSENTGFASACNQGAQSGISKYIAFVNPDCFVKPSQLQELAQSLRSHADTGLVGCRVINEDGTLQAASRRRLPSFWRVLFHVTGLAKLPWIKGINIKDQGKFIQTVKVEAVNGACYVVSREDFERINGFDEGFPLHFEDLDLFTRILKQNKSILYQSSIEVKHLQGQSRQDSNQIKVWKKQGLKRYFSKHRPSWEAKIVNWLL